MCRARVAYSKTEGVEKRPNILNYVRNSRKSFLFQFIAVDVLMQFWLYYRYAAFYENNGTLSRDHFKAYGLSFIIKVTGRAGKFNIVPLLINIGSGIGLLAFVGIHSFVHSRIHPVQILLH